MRMLGKTVIEQCFQKHRENPFFIRKTRSSIKFPERYFDFYSITLIPVNKSYCTLASMISCNLNASSRALVLVEVFFFKEKPIKIQSAWLKIRSYLISDKSSHPFLQKRSKKCCKNQIFCFLFQFLNIYHRILFSSTKQII